MQTTLTRIFIDVESVSDGLSEILDEMSRKFRRFFRPKSGDLQKTKKKKVIFRPKSKIQTFSKSGDLQKKKKKRSSPKFRAIFLPISHVQTIEGGLFSNGGGYFHFSQKIGLKSTKNMRFCILHKPMGGLEPPPPPPGYATGCSGHSASRDTQTSTKGAQHNHLKNSSELCKGPIAFVPKYF